MLPNYRDSLMSSKPYIELPNIENLLSGNQYVEQYNWKHWSFK